MKPKEEEVKEEVVSKPKKPFRIPKFFGFMGKMILGFPLLTAIVLGIYSAYWVLFPGSFRLGVHVSDHLGWDIAHNASMNEAGHTASFWIVGIGTVIIPILGVWIAYCLGNSAVQKLSKKIK